MGQQDAAIVLVLILAFFALLLFVVIAFLLTLSKCLGKIQRRNRTMEPGMVWLNLVPCLNIVWQFITVFRISDSLRNEYDDNNWPEQGDYGKSLGLSALVFNFVSSVINNVVQVPAVSVVVGIVSLTLWIMYWVKIAGFSRQIDRFWETYGDDDDGDDDRERLDDRDDEFDSRRR